MAEIEKSLIDLYLEMYDITNPLCAKCDPPYHCCELAGCEQAKSWAREVYQTDLEELPNGKLPFLSDTGCTVAPHMRMVCAQWLCKQAIVLAPPRFFELKAMIVKTEALLWKNKTDPNRSR